MNRRGFLGLLVGGLATAAAVRTFPFRVYSFPSEIEPVRFHLPDPLTAEQVGTLQLEFFRDKIRDLTEADRAIYHKFVEADFRRLSRNFSAFTPDKAQGHLPLGSAWPVTRITKIDRRNKIITYSTG
jgi:hypothetical protein